MLVIMKNGTTQTAYRNGALASTGAVAADMQSVLAPLTVGGCWTTRALRFMAWWRKSLVYNRALSTRNDSRWRRP